MSALVVTGGAGFIGANFVRLALDEGYDRVVVVDKLTYAGNLASLREVRDDARFRFVRADIADAEAMKVVFRDHPPGALVNFAAESHVDRSIDAPGEFIRTNIQGVFVLLECARAHLKSGAVSPGEFRFLHVSTDEVYGSLGAEGLFTESTPYAPNSPYAASKASADHLVRAYHRTYGLPALLTNCSNNYGPYQFPEKLIPLMILNALEGRELPIYGDGAQVRDWIYVEDHCRGVLAALRSGRPGRSYNIGGRSERTNVEVVDRICGVLERLRPAADNVALQSAGAASYLDLKRHVTDRPGHDRRYAIDPARIETELGWRPRHDFESGLEKTVRWYLDHLDWCEAVQSGAYRRERLGLGEGDATG